MKTKTTQARRAASRQKGKRTLSVPALRRIMRSRGIGHNALQAALVASGEGGKIADYLAGRCGPSVPALAVMAQALGVRMEDLIRG